MTSCRTGTARWWLPGPGTVAKVTLTLGVLTVGLVMLTLATPPGPVRPARDSGASGRTAERRDRQQQGQPPEAELPPTAADQGDALRWSTRKVVGCPGECRCSYERYPRSGSTDPLLAVNCSGSGLFDIPARLPPSTQILDMSRNRLQNLTSLPRLSDLRVLDVAGNWIHRIDNSWLFEHVQQLRVLRLASNGLRSLDHGTFLGLSHLVELDLSDNLLQRAEIHAFADLARLEVFSLDGNGLWEIKRGWLMAMPSLVELRLANNALTRLVAGTLARLPRLQHLDLSNNRLRRIDPSALAGLDKLRLVNLSGNAGLTEVPTPALAGVPWADIFLLDSLGPRSLRRHAVSGLRVVELSLSYLPELRAVGRAAFHDLPRLQTLQLHDCPKLAFLHPGAFSHLPRLKRLLLHNNGLLAVAASVPASLPALGHIHLYHNPLRCDCNAYWLRAQLSDYSSRFYASVNTDDSGDMSKQLTKQPPEDTIKVAEEALPPYTSESLSANNSIIHSYNRTTNTPGLISGNINISMAKTSVTDHYPFSSIISEPGRVTCFFPAESFSSPLVQQPLQYFPQSCPPRVIPFYPTLVNVSVGEPLDLECRGIGVPEPDLQWVLPNGVQINASTQRAAHERGGVAKPIFQRLASPSEWTASGGPLKKSLPPRRREWDIHLRAEIAEDGSLHIPRVGLSDSGMYGCRASSSAGHDISTVRVIVQPRSLSLSTLRESSSYITVVWEGSIPRAQLHEFQLYYRRVPAQGAGLPGPTDSPDTTSKGRGADTYSEEPDILESKDSDYSVVNLSPGSRTCIISGLEPLATYEVCLVYRGSQRLQCRYPTTTARDGGARVTRTDAGIAVHVSRAQIGAGIGLALALLVTVWAALVARRFRRRRSRKDYTSCRDRLGEDRAAIQLEGLREGLCSTPSTPAVGVAPHTPLTSSRTALLTHSNT